METIIARRPLERSRVDHALAGIWKGSRDCHIEPDWILIYQVDGDGVIFQRTGIHTDLF